MEITLANERERDISWSFQQFYNAINIWWDIKNKWKLKNLLSKSTKMSTFVGESSLL